MENSSSLTEQDKKSLARIYIKVKVKVNAENEEQAAISDLKYSNSNLISKKIELANLKDSLFDYFKLKGLKNSLFSSDDMIAMINSELEMLEANIFDNQESVRVIKELSRK